MTPVALMLISVVFLIVSSLITIVNFLKINKTLKDDGDITDVSFTIHFASGGLSLLSLLGLVGGFIWFLTTLQGA